MLCEVLRSHSGEDHGHVAELVHNVLRNSTDSVLIMPRTIGIPLLLREDSDLKSREGLPRGGSIRSVTLFG